MKKALLLTSCLLLGMTKLSAQVPDASKWKVGDDITDQVSWGNLSFENDPMDFWKFESTKGTTTTTGGLFECYDGENADLYQYVQLPAGMYKVECQGYYRCGTSWDDDPNSYGDESRWEDNAEIYVQNGTYDITSDKFTGGRSFSNPLMPRLFDFQDTKIYDMHEAGDADPGWDMTDGDYGAKGWGPTSVPGSLKWFQAGKYMPYDEDDVTYNTVNFFLVDDGYVRIGVKKTAVRSADSFMATNFKMYYMGEAGEAAELMALQDDITDYYKKVEAIRDTYDGGLLYTLLGDALMEEIDGAFGTVSNMSKEECEEALPIIIALYDKALQAQEARTRLADVIGAMENLASKTDYAGKAAFNTALQNAQSLIDPDNEDVEGDFDSFDNAYNELLAARVVYLQTQDKVDGAYDFTSLIAYPWFCNPEFEPTWDAGANWWAPNQAALDAGWSDYDDVDGTGKGRSDEGKAEATPIADKVTISSNSSVVGQWYQVNNGLVIYWNDNLSCAKKWDMPHTDADDYQRDIAQRITGVPNGYYKLKALAQTWMNDWNDADKLCKNRIFIQSGENVSESAYLEPGGWWGKDINQWKELETDMILVSDGEILIACRDNGFSAVTGFRLYYYGETPDYATLIQPEINAVKESIDGLTWAGDKAAANKIMADIPAEINDDASFQLTKVVLGEAKEYVANANKAINNFKADQTYTELMTQYEDEEEQAILTKALEYAIMLGTTESDTYELVEGANTAAAAYTTYLATYEKAKAYNSAALNDLLTKQAAVLKEAYQEAKVLDKYVQELAFPMNIADMEAKGAGDATEAQPLDITSMMKNPTFAEGPIRDMIANTSTEGAPGWDCEFNATINEYGRENAELWNKGPFTFSQKIAGLPAGTYELRVKAIYRDGNDVGAQRFEAYQTAGDEEAWNNHNAQLFARTSDSNDEFTYVKAIESLISSENSFTEVVTRYDKEEDMPEPFPVNITTMAPTGEGEDVETASYNHVAEGSYPFDEKLTVGENTYYFPASMYGFYMWCVNKPEAVTNKVQITINSGDVLEVGIRKTDAIGNDWVIMDDFELYYLSGDTFKNVLTGIAEVTPATQAGNDAIYNLAGQRVDKNYKGIIIQNGVKKYAK